MTHPNALNADNSRRDFMAGTLALGAASIVAPYAFGAMGNGIRPSANGFINVALIGCGGRGGGAANDTLTGNPGVRLVALADINTTTSKSLRDELKKKFGDRVTATDADIFDGIDGYLKVLARTDVDLVILATAPGFRPQHITAAVAAKKHVFAEKPVCVDAAGYHICCAAHDAALAQGTAIATGTQYRRQGSFVDAIAKIREGMIGDVVGMTARYCSNGIWYRDRKPGMSDMEYQIYNWMHFIWLSGDQITEQAVHNIDCIHWVMGGPPTRAFASGSRWQRPEDSEMWDSFSIDYEWADGKVCSLQCRHWPNSTVDCNNVVYGSKGTATIRAFSDGSVIHDRSGKELWKTKGDIGAAYVAEHKALVASIAEGKPIVELRQTAESSLMAVMGREAAYSGTVTTWDFMTKESKLALFPSSIDLQGSAPTPFVRRPGEYKLT
ncbi:MAG: Gfo/Idh/MocA family oxidoreductase [Phycisphaerales bacterium]|nr:Gfo/Idh/MocA family oxidoreductase [Phycisphaerales bacterium]